MLTLRHNLQPKNTTMAEHTDCVQTQMPVTTNCMNEYNLDLSSFSLGKFVFKSI